MSKQEEWKPILNHENYEISNEGNIRRKSTGTPVKQALDDREYYSIMLWTNKKQYKKRVHRLIWNSFNDCECKQTVDHINQDKHDNRLENLRCISNRDNAKNRGTISNKTNKYNLTPELKRSLVIRYKAGELTSYQIYKEYGIPSNYFFECLKRGRWEKS
jgi:hypothetical protein